MTTTTKNENDTTTTRRQKFVPQEHMMQIKQGKELKDYLPVQWRLVWFREDCPQGTIETEMIFFDSEKECEGEYTDWTTGKPEKKKKIVKGFVIFHAVIKDGKGGIAHGTKSESAASFADYVEKAETGSIGRALAGLGFGTQFEPDLDEAYRLVDAPVTNNTSSAPAPTPVPEKKQQPVVNFKPAVVSTTTNNAQQLLTDADKKEVWTLLNGWGPHEVGAFKQYSKLPAKVDDWNKGSLAALPEHIQVWKETRQQEWREKLSSTSEPMQRALTEMQGFPAPIWRDMLRSQNIAQGREIISFTCAEADMLIKFSKAMGATPEIRQGSAAYVSFLVELTTLLSGNAEAQEEIQVILRGKTVSTTFFGGDRIGLLSLLQSLMNKHQGLTAALKAKHPEQVKHLMESLQHLKKAS